MTPPDIDLVEMRNTAVAGGHGDVFELDVHVVLGCFIVSCVFKGRTVVGLAWLDRFGTGGVDVPSKSFPR